MEQNTWAEYTAHDLDFIEVRRNEGIVGLFSITGNLNDESYIKNSKKYICQRTSFQMEVRSMREL